MQFGAQGFCSVEDSRNSVNLGQAVYVGVGVQQLAYLQLISEHFRSIPTFT